MRSACGADCACKRSPLGLPTKRRDALLPSPAGGRGAGGEGVCQGRYPYTIRFEKTKYAYSVALTVALKAVL